MRKTATTIIIFLLIIFATALIWFRYFKAKSIPFETGLEKVSDEIAAGKEFIGLIKNIKTIKLDTTIFDDPIYKSLIDFSVVIEIPQKRGRLNPFIPVNHEKK